MNERELADEVRNINANDRVLGEILELFENELVDNLSEEATKYYLRWQDRTSGYLYEFLWKWRKY